MSWLTRLFRHPAKPPILPRGGIQAMCGHKHVVLHRRDTAHHHMVMGEPEVSCSCNPGIVCPVCDWRTLHDTCLIMAPDEIVDQHAVRPPSSVLN